MSKKNQHGGRRKGAGRPREIEERQKVTIYIDGDTLKQIDQIADGAGIKRSMALRLAIKRWVSCR